MVVTIPIQSPQIQITEDDFYAQRDHRTDLWLKQSGDPVAVAVTISPEWAETPGGQLTLYWLNSLIARSGRRYNHLQLWLPSSIAGLPTKFVGAPAPTLGPALIEHLRNADPFG